jgi:hypothetical protein
VGNEDCEEGQECGADHGCHPVVVCASDKDCKDKGMVCNKDVGICMECLKTEHCGPGEYCGSGYCLSAACASGESKCEGNAVTVCKGDGSGWQVGTPCVDGQYCLDGTCLDLACQPFAIWCDGDVYKVCADDGKSVKYQEDCAAQGKHCFESACIDSVCTPLSEFCVDASTGATCSGDGMSYAEVPCGAQQFCEDGVCTAWVCQPNAASCEGNVAKVCNTVGSGFASQLDCGTQAMVCVGGQCLDLVCEPSKDFCVDNDTAAHCAVDGMSATSQECPAQQSCAGGVCLPWVCSPGVPMCLGEVATECDAAGLGPLPIGFDCQLAGMVCHLGVCVSCAPKCDDAVCGDDGCGGSCGACPSPMTCQAGKCVCPPGPCTGKTMEAYLCSMEMCLGSSLVSSQIYSPTGDETSSAWAAVSHFGSDFNDLAPIAGSSYALLATGPAEGTAHSTDLCCGNSAGDPFAKDGYETYDNMEFKAVMKAPVGALGFAIDYIFLSEEYEEWIGSSFNDKFYIILKAPKTTNDQKVVVNSTQCSNPGAYYDIIEPGGEKKCYIAINTAFSEPCNNVQTDISGTGFSCGPGDEAHGSSTGWLTTSWPIAEGETFELYLHIHDSSDGIYDSEVVLDNFRFLYTPFTPGTVALK